MKSIYYKYEGNTYNMSPIVIANPYKHLTIFNDSDVNINVFNEQSLVAYIPAHSSITLYDVFSNNLINDKFNPSNTALYFETTPNPNSNITVHIINFGV